MMITLAIESLGEATALTESYGLKAIAVILKTVDADQPPLHLPLGEPAYSATRNKFAAVMKTMDAWEAEATATSF